MSLKTKLVSSISAFVLVLALLVVGVFALPQANVPLGGTINFQATNVYAEITGTISGQENGPASLPKLEFSNNQTPDTSGWAKGALVFDPNASPIQIQIAINVKNLSGERSLFVKVDDLIGAVTNLTKSVMVGAEDQEGAYVEVLPGQSVDYVISLSPTDEGEPVTGEYNYLITLIDESEAQDIEIQANPNMETLGSVSGGGTFDLGETVELTATASGSNKFLAWATSLDPNTMEILSTSTTYSFELSPDSPRTYFALFNKPISSGRTVGNLKYTFYNEAKLASVTGTTSDSLSGALGIPSVVESEGNSYKVFSIGNDAFQGCNNLTSITIPKGVTSIGNNAFYDCSKLTTVSLPTTLTEIGDRAFSGCSGLTSATLPSTLTSIGSYAFSGCNKLASITIPESVTSIGEGAFQVCISLEAFNGDGNEYYTIDENRALLVDGGKTLLAYAIGNTAASYQIPEGVTRIGSAAFSYCSSLTEITLPSTSIGSAAFSNCSSLTEITINGNIKGLYSNAFSGCNNLTSLTLGAEVKSLMSSLFTGENLTNLTEIVVEEGSTLGENIALPSYATWYKGESQTPVTSFSGAGTYLALTVTALPNDSSLGSANVSAPGAISYGDTITLRATSLDSNTFLAWATSLDPNTMEILSTSATYSFELTMDSPRTYYALFNSTETEQTVGDLIYTFYNEAKLASVTDTATTSVPSGDFTIPSVVPGGENSYKVYSIGDDAFDSCRSLTSIKIPEGVTSIGVSAFNYCSGLTSITLPSTLTSIGSSAFDSCSSLTSITIPERVTSIDANTFDGCSSLTSIKIPEGVTSIGTYAFSGCSGLTSITIPERVTSIGATAFYNCSNLTSIKIPEGVTSIESYTFYGCSSLTSITLPSKLTSIGNYAFEDCSSLTSIKIPEGVTSIGSSAFSGCSNLTSITIPEGVTSIGAQVFYGCRGLTSIIIPEGVTSIGTYTFYNCSGLTQITINGDITTLGSSAFSGCTSLTKLTLGANVTSIPSNLFSTNMLTNLNEIVVEAGPSLTAALPTYAEWYKDDDPKEVTNFSGAGTYSTTKPTTITVEANQASLGSVSGGGAYAIGDTVELTATASGSTFLAWATSLDPNTMEILSTSSTYSFELSPDSPIVYYALFNQTRSIKQTVGNLIYTFYNEAKLASVTDTTSTSLSGALEIPSVVSSGENSYKVFSIGANAFSNCRSLTSITIPEGVTSINIYAFQNCSSLTSITIPGGVTSIGYNAFSGCSSLEAFSGDGNEYYTIDDNRALLVDGGKTLLAYAPANTATSYEIPESVTSIGDSAFYYCKNLTSITIPAGVTSIGNTAFYYCSSLTEITIPEGVTSIGSNAFFNCSSLTEITIPEGVTEIGNDAFRNCSGLTSITISEGVTEIGERAFQGCSSLNSITLPTTLTSIGSEAFSYCSKLTSITIPEGVTSIGNSAFYYCRSLEAFNGDGNEYYTIYENRALLVDGGKTLLAYAPANTATSYTIPEGVTSIGSAAFQSCSSLTSITISEGVTEIGERAFWGCSGLTSIILPSTLTSIGGSAFFGCSGLTQITINGNISSLGSSAFYSCTSLTKLTLGANVTSIPSNLFTDNNLTELNEIVVHGDLNSTTFPIGDWLKDGATVTSFTGEGTYIKQV